MLSQASNIRKSDDMWVWIELDLDFSGCIALGRFFGLEFNGKGPGWGMKQCASGMDKWKLDRTGE